MIIQIDSENFSIKRAPSLFAIAQNLGSWQEIYIYGSARHLQSWQPYSDALQMSPRMHTGGPQAADRMLCNDAKSFYQQGARVFLLAADDGDYARPVCALIEMGCEVFVAGSQQAARELKKVCTDFFVALVVK